jgi:hypothetical protein
MLMVLQEVNNTETDNPEARRYFQTECRKAAEEIVHFMCSLQPANFREFWLPCKSTHRPPRRTRSNVMQTALSTSHQLLHCSSVVRSRLQTKKLLAPA